MTDPRKSRKCGEMLESAKLWENAAHEYFNKLILINNTQETPYGYIVRFTPGFSLNIIREYMEELGGRIEINEKEGIAESFLRRVFPPQITIFGFMPRNSKLWGQETYYITSEVLNTEGYNRVNKKQC